MVRRLACTAQAAQEQVPGMVQLPLFNIPVQQKAAGASGEDHLTQPHPFLHLIPRPSNEQEP
jgi:hypothetical protein